MCITSGDMRLLLTSAWLLAEQIEYTSSTFEELEVNPAQNLRNLDDSVVLGAIYYGFITVEHQNAYLSARLVEHVVDMDASGRPSLPTVVRKVTDPDVSPPAGASAQHDGAEGYAFDTTFDGNVGSTTGTLVAVQDKISESVLSTTNHVDSVLVTAVNEDELLRIAQKTRSELVGALDGFLVTSPVDGTECVRLGLGPAIL